MNSFSKTRELWRNLWKKQAVLGWKKEVAQHWYHHCTELRLPRPSESLSYHFRSWSRPQLWLPGKLLKSDVCVRFKNNLWILPFYRFQLCLFLYSSTTLGLNAPPENPKAKTRRRREITSCMQEPHPETNSTTTSSPSVAFATSARCWRRREATALLVCRPHVLVSSFRNGLNPWIHSSSFRVWY